jgi:cbb3-type cytochrome oxidase subunit 3
MSDLLQSIAAYGPGIGLFFFIVFFVLVLAWTLRGGKGRFEAQRLMPFQDDSLPSDTATKGTLHE